MGEGTTPRGTDTPVHPEKGLWRRGGPASALRSLLPSPDQYTSDAKAGARQHGLAAFQNWSRGRFLSRHGWAPGSQVPDICLWALDCSQLDPRGHKVLLLTTHSEGEKVGAGASEQSGGRRSSILAASGPPFLMLTCSRLLRPSEIPWDFSINPHLRSNPLGLVSGTSWTRYLC